MTWSYGDSLADDGKDGTIYLRGTNTALGPESPKKASAPTPKDGDEMVYAGTPGGGSISLKWYSGYGASTDEVYCDTSNPPATKIGATVVATARGEKTSTVPKVVTAGQTYYMQVRTDTGSSPVLSDVWSFTVVGWECPEPNWATADVNDGNNVNGWPVWDVTQDCVVNNEDFWYFAKDWRVNRGGSQNDLGYTLDHYTQPPLPTSGPMEGLTSDLDGLANMWLECEGRTNNGCAGW